jgi:hypothetical protein
MHKIRISTTISPKHFAILKKHAKEHGTQQKALELALETFDKKALEGSSLSQEESFILRAWREKMACVIYKELLSMLIKTADLKQSEDWYNTNTTVMAFMIEFLNQRPFKELSLREVLDDLVTLAKISNFFNRYTYSDEGDHYMLKIYHDYGFNGSKYFLFTVENLFNFCGVKYKSSVSDKTIFVKIYKNEPARQGVLSSSDKLSFHEDIFMKDKDHNQP